MHSSQVSASWMLKLWVHTTGLASEDACINLEGKYKVHLIVALQKKNDGLGKHFSIRLFSISIYVVSHKKTLKIEIWLRFMSHLHTLFSCRLIYSAPLLKRPQVSTGKGASLGVVMRELWCHDPEFNLRMRLWFQGLGISLSKTQYEECETTISRSLPFLACHQMTIPAHFCNWWGKGI